MLTFVIPVRHQATVADWGEIRELIAATLRSVAAQAGGTWRIVVVANRGAALPELPRGAELQEVDFEPVMLPRRHADPDLFYSLVRLDKGRRVLAGLLHARPSGHVMVVDYDDFVSNRLAGFVAAHAGANGWFLGSGYLHSGGAEALLLEHNFHRHCGTSHVIRADLLGLPASFEAADDEQVRRWLGAHVFIQRDLLERGSPLAPLPFPGAVYRIGHPHATSRSPTLAGHIRHAIRTSGEDPGTLRSIERRTRPVDAAFAAEFFGAQSGSP